MSVNERNLVLRYNIWCNKPNFCSIIFEQYCTVFVHNYLIMKQYLAKECKRLQLSHNISLNEIFKKGALVVKRTFVHLIKYVQVQKNTTDVSGNNIIYLFGCIFLRQHLSLVSPF